MGGGRGSGLWEDKDEKTSETGGPIKPLPRFHSFFVHPLKRELRNLVEGSKVLGARVSRASCPLMHSSHLVRRAPCCSLATYKNKIVLGKKGPRVGP